MDEISKTRLDIFHILAKYDLEDMFFQPENEFGVIAFLSDPEVVIHIAPEKDDGTILNGVLVDIKGTYYLCNSLDEALQNFIETFFDAPFEGDLPKNPLERLLNVQFFEFI